MVGEREEIMLRRAEDLDNLSKIPVLLEKMDGLVGTVRQVETNLSNRIEKLETLRERIAILETEQLTTSKSLDFFNKWLVNFLQEQSKIQLEQNKTVKDSGKWMVGVIITLGLSTISITVQVLLAILGK